MEHFPVEHSSVDDASWLDRFAARLPCDDQGLVFVKGHGTLNDFLVLPDPHGALELTGPLVAALCDRRGGVGADGVLHVVGTGRVPEVAGLADQAEWFMDYRNADGTVASMCGNGIRVFTAFLVRAGWVEPGAGPVPVATRGGLREVTYDEESGLLTVDMGRPDVAQMEVPVTVSIDDTARPAVVIHMPNPHAVVTVADLGAFGPVLSPPSLWPPDAFPEGVNVELVELAAPGHVRMRVHERGVGETFSCGTGACAVAVAARRQFGLDASDDALRGWQVRTRGGPLQVTERSDGHVELCGPAELVATGHVSVDWVTRHAGTVDNRMRDAAAAHRPVEPSDSPQAMPGGTRT